MSSSKNEKRLGRLLAQAGAGVEIRVLDSDGHELARGKDFISMPLEEGVYAVEWISAGIRTESLVRILASSLPVEVKYKPEYRDNILHSYSEDLPKGEFLLRGREKSMRRIAEYGARSMFSYRSSVLVVVSAEVGTSPEEVSSLTRLLDRTGQVCGKGRPGDTELALGSSERAHIYNVDSGLYRLEFHSITGEVVQITIPALRNRQTVAFLRAVRGDVLVAEAEGFVRVERVGIEAASTVVISVDGREDDHRIRERIRLTGVLLHDLAVGMGSLSRNFVEILDDPATDPLLQLYGAMVVLCQFEQECSPSTDDPWPKDEGLPVFRERWLSRAARWIGVPGTAGSPPDRTAAWWRLSSLLNNHGETSSRARILKRISAPPMLECAWRWSIRHSVNAVDAIPVSPVMLAVVRSPIAASPWLCWKMSAAKAAPATLPRASSIEWQEMIDSLAEKAKTIVKQKNNYELFERLSPEVGATALHLANFAPNQDKLVQKYELPVELAVSLALPGRSLKKRLMRVDRELSAALTDVEINNESGVQSIIVDSKLHAFQMAPGLQRRILVPDDPQKGRFGGKDRLNGFVATAQFDDTRFPELTRVRIIVEGDAADGTVAYFYLHDSFTPLEHTVHFRKRIAQLEVIAWGAFTVGVWLPEHGVELELDLALLREAPFPFKSR